DLFRRIWSQPRQRRHCVRLTMSRELVRVGDEGTLHRRWTPPQAMTVEDELDSLDVYEAARHEYPASPSARAIQGAQIRGGKEQRRRLFLRKERKTMTVF